MFARIHKAMEEREEGFTLIELLVVIIIIGILAAIAIPVFLSQRKKAYDAGVKSDLNTVATAQETYLTDNSSYANAQQLDGNATVGADGTLAKITNGDFVNVFTNAGQGYCLVGGNSNDPGKYYVYNSEQGGLQSGTSASPTTSCTTGFTAAGYMKMTSGTLTDSATASYSP